MGDAVFQFYDEVLVRPASPGLEEIAGELGAILGMAEEGGRWSYAVLMYSKDRCWSVSEADILPTGRKRKKEEFYDGASIRVSARGHVSERLG